MQLLEVYVPGTNGPDKLDTNLQAVTAREIAQELTRAYGGATSSYETGYYQAQDGRIIEEPIIRVYCYVPAGQEEDAKEHAAMLADRIKRRHRQESTMTVIDGKPRFY